MKRSLVINSPSNQYVLYESLLGRGAYGVVLLAKQSKDQQLYAIKILHKNELHRLNAVPNVSQEILLQTKLRHKNILPLIETFEDDQYLYIALEHCARGSLRQVLRKGRVSEIQARKYFVQILDALHYLHANNILHRDLKPDNLLLTSDDTIKLCDFNWATQVCALGTAPPVQCGTLDYMPPEVLQGLPQTSKVDIFSLGVVLYELLHDSLPQKGSTETGPSLSPECQQLLRALLSADPRLRPTSRQIYNSKWLKLDHGNSLQPHQPRMSMDMDSARRVHSTVF